MRRKATPSGMVATQDFMAGSRYQQWGQPYQKTSSTSTLSPVSVGCTGFRVT